MERDNKSYTDLEVWQLARKLTSEVYAVSRLFPKEELFGLTNQLRRAAVSVPSNIAEGCGRQTPRDTINFLFIARGSLYELETQLYVALDLQYLNSEVTETLFAFITSCKKLLHGFINHYRQQVA
ncbi:four helix bundle protein [Hymenobacter sp. BT664]|uniref:Four helix bundle protein n=1 Tax=Hymenobacter montanus TaxID=2771359 RepID=A0A927BBR5_9BACT|nr:four helix bundle protein [Hymenobacter montanus]MBD2767826.1 four helix bundle protein [Hymenobacter montanus]